MVAVKNNVSSGNGKIVQFSDYRKKALPNVENILNEIPQLIAHTRDIREEKNIIIEHDATPIKSTEDINKIVEYFLSMGKYRDMMMFIVCCNIGLRVSDFRLLKFNNFIDDNMQFKEYFILNEEKTNNRRKIYINNAVKLAITIYLQNCITNDKIKTLYDYLFVSEESNNRKVEMIDVLVENKIVKREVQSPLAIRSIDPILKNATKQLGIKGRYSTHAYRKTFSYHMLMQASTTSLNDRKVGFLQSVLGHKSPATTLRYAGFTDDEIKESYMNLNIGRDILLQWMNSNYSFTDPYGI